MAEQRYYFTVRDKSYDSAGNVVMGGSRTVGVTADSPEQALSLAQQQARGYFGSENRFLKAADLIKEGATNLVGKRYSYIEKDLGVAQQVQSRGVGEDGSLVKKTQYVLPGEQAGFSNELSKEYGGIKEVDEFTPQQLASDPNAIAYRRAGESVSDFTQRLDTPQDLWKRADETPEQYMARVFGSSSGARTGTPGGEYTGSQGGSGYSPAVGTSFAERYKDLQKELGLGKPPTAPDYFTGADQARLGTARDERAAIEAEMAEILNERLAIDEELQKFGINAGEGTTEAGRIGAVSEAQRNANERLMVLNRRELVLETKLRSRNTVISELMSLQRQEYEDAVEQYNTQFTRALQLYQIFDEEQDEARAEAKEARNELKANAAANLQVLSNAYQAQIESGQITQLSGMQRAKLEELETQAGLPIGSTMAVLSTLKPSEEKLWSGIDDFGNFKYIYRDANGTIGVRTAAGAVPQKVTGTKTGSGGSSSGGSTGGFSPEVQQVLDGVRTLKSFTPSVQQKVTNELYSLGYGSSTPPDWFESFVKELFGIQGSINPTELKKQWQSHKAWVFGSSDSSSSSSGSVSNPFKK